MRVPNAQPGKSDADCEGQHWFGRHDELVFSKFRPALLPEGERTQLLINAVIVHVKSARSSMSGKATNHPLGRFDEKPSHHDGNSVLANVRPLLD
jgi:hypothetical protein